MCRIYYSLFQKRGTKIKEEYSKYIYTFTYIHIKYLRIYKTLIILSAYGKAIWMGTVYVWAGNFSVSLFRSF